MAYTTVFEDIIFVEGENSKAEPKVELKANLMGIGAQMNNLNNVKSNMANQARVNGCNCITNFKYGQKSALFSFDDVKWYANGTGCILPDDEYQKIIDKKK